MASQPNQLKSILKDPSTAKASPADPRALALQHATLLQTRKDIESQILDNLVLLSEYPLERSPPHPASSPAPSDNTGFKSLVRLFQPSDYDDLIEERNVNGLCGYTLCAKPRRQTGGGGEWKLAGNGDIVKRKDIETWCSQACAKRAMFVKVQLNETAAWERAGIPDITIDLLDEGIDDESEADRTARKLENLKLEDQRQAARDTLALALERGEPKWTRKKIKVTLRENETEAPPPLGDDIPSTEDDHLLVEGHKIKLQEKSTKHA